MFLGLKDLITEWQLERVDHRIKLKELTTTWQRISSYKEDEVTCLNFDENKGEFILEVGSNVLMSLLQLQKTELLCKMNDELIVKGYAPIKKLRFRLSETQRKIKSSILGSTEALVKDL